MTLNHLKHRQRLYSDGFAVILKKYLETRMDLRFAENAVFKEKIDILFVNKVRQRVRCSL